MLGPTGWTRLGPLPPGADPARGEVVFDLSNCDVELARVDLDGGPGNPDVRLARRWVGGRWEWEDDWRLRDGMLLRPGRTPRPYAGAPVDGEDLTFDDQGRLRARRREGRTLEILRDAGGGFIGMQAGPVSVRIDGAVGRASDGREVRWRWEGGELRSVAGADGTVVYTWAEGRPASVRWSDEQVLVFSTSSNRTEVRGSWTGTCERKGEGDVAITGSLGVWRVSRDGSVLTVTDASGAGVRSREGAAGILGWTDPRGGETRVDRDAEGHVVGVTEPGGGRWSFAWDGGLVRVEGPDGARWTMTRGPEGVEQLTDPAGRAASWSRSPGGGVRTATIGAGHTEIARDDAGRVVSVTDPVGAKVDLLRDPAGRVVRVRDPSGAAWDLGRDTAGRVVRLADPGGGDWGIERDTLGRVVGLRTPESGRIRWSRLPDGTPQRVVRDGAVWQILWAGPAQLSGWRDPGGATTGFERDGAGRVRSVRRADGAVVRLSRDAAGDVTRLNELTIRRDAAGRPLGLPELGVWWDIDPAGRVVGVTAPGVGFQVLREAGGTVRGVRLGEETITLTRDSQGRVVEATGAVPTRLTRDAAGRIVGLASGEDGWTLVRDVRGLPSRLRWGAETWTWGRDALARVVEVAGGDARLGVDRDGLGRPSMVRFPDGSLAKIERVDGEVRVVWSDRDGAPRGTVGWAEALDGALSRLTMDGTWLLRRDPNGALAAAEAGERAWSRAPDGIEGPDGSFVRYDAHGRPASASGLDAWGLGSPLTYTLGEAGEVRRITGPKGTVTLGYDAVGRLVTARGPAGTLTVTRDAFGRLARVGRTAVQRWEEAILEAGSPGVLVEGVAQASAKSATIFAPDGTPLAMTRGPLSFSPTGLRAGGGPTSGGRWAAGPLFGLLDTRDPLSGQDLGASVRWPWTLPTWEPEVAVGPSESPDGSASPTWDPGYWAPESPWADPLSLLVEAGALPDGGPRGRRVPGLPWLPAAFAPSLPSPVPDPLAMPLDDEPLVELLVTHLAAPTHAPSAEELAAVLVPLPLPRLPPGLLGATPY